MTSRIAKPFLTIPDDALKFEGWLIGEPDTPLSHAGAIYEPWDYARDLCAFVSIELDFDAIGEGLEVDADHLVIHAYHSYGTGPGNVTRLKRTLKSYELTKETPLAEFEDLLTASQLSGRVRLSLDLILGEDIKGYSSISPVLAGSRLWNASHDILLEGGGSALFPLENVSFSKVFKGRTFETAPWFLDWHAESFHADFAGAIRLFINTDNEDTAQRIAEGDLATLQALMSDVMNQLCSGALDSQEYLDAFEEFPEESLGSQVKFWLENAFPSMSLVEIVSQRQIQPNIFAASLLAASEIRSAI